MKHTLLIFGLLWALGASGQIYIDSYRFGAAPAATLLLDDYPNAAGAYSLRKLRTAYTGNCIQVRRLSDGTTSNVAFSGNYLDTAALKTFCASTDCFVRTWYDQSTNARDAVMTVDANQPQIVASGVIFRSAGHPALDFDGSNDHLTIASAYTTTTTQTDIAVMNRTTSTQGVSVGGTLTISAGIRSDNRAYFRNSTGAVAQSVVVSESGFNLVSTFYTSPNVNYYINATNSYSISYTFTTAGSTINALGRFGGIYNAADLYEIITWATDRSSDRTAIESEIDNFYNIY